MSGSGPGVFCPWSTRPLSPDDCCGIVAGNGLLVVGALSSQAALPLSDTTPHSYQGTGLLYPPSPPILILIKKNLTLRSSLTSQKKHFSPHTETTSNSLYTAWPKVIDTLKGDSQLYEIYWQSCCASGEALDCETMGTCQSDTGCQLISSSWYPTWNMFQFSNGFPSSQQWLPRLEEEQPGKVVSVGEEGGMSPDGEIPRIPKCCYRRSQVMF